MDFSIVIPTYGRPRQIAACVKSLTLLDYPRDQFEVIIVDDCSPMRVASAIDKARGDLPVRLIRHPKNAGPATARNSGADIANGRYIAFTDDDCAPSPDWLRAFKAQFALHPNAMVGGYTINVLRQNIYSVASQALLDYIYDHFNRDPQKATFFASNNMAMPMDKFRRLRGFDASLPRAAGEDRDLCDRWAFHGFPLVYSPAVTIRHFHALSIRKFWKQHFTYGRGAFSYHMLRAKRENAGIKIERMTFYRNLIAHAFKAERGSRAKQLAALLTLSQAANAMGFFWEAGFGGFKMIEGTRQ